MSRVELIDADPNGSAVFKFQLKPEYGNLNGVFFLFDLSSVELQSRSAGRPYVHRSDISKRVKKKPWAICQSRKNYVTNINTS